MGDSPVPGSNSATADADARARVWVDLSTLVRKRADLFAKSLGGLGTAALTAVGIAKFADVFPLPPIGDIPALLWVALIATIGGFVAMGVALVWFSSLLWSVSEPVILPLDPEHPGPDERLSPEELTLVQAAYGAQLAAHKDFKSLVEYANHASKLERRAAKIENTPQPVDEARQRKAASLRGRAAGIRAEIGEAQARALLNVVRSRAAGAVRGHTSKWLVASFLVGLVAFGVGSDYLAAQHTDDLAAVDRCAAAIRSAAEVAPATVRLLPPLCDASPADVARAAPKEDTADAALSGTIADATARYVACRGALVTAGDRATRAERAMCARIRLAIVDALGPASSSTRAAKNVRAGKGANAAKGG